MAGIKKIIVLAVGILFCLSCNNELMTALNAKVGFDTGAPVPGNSGALQIDATTQDIFRISWTKGTDDLSLQNALKYQVFYSKAGNLNGTPAQIIANGISFPETPTPTANISTIDGTGLDDAVQYYVNVVVQDEKGVMSAYKMASDTAAKHWRLYWIERANHLIRRAELDGSKPQNVYSTGVSTQPTAIAIDAVNRKIYYTQVTAPQTISRIEFDGTNRVDLITSNLTTPRGIALDTLHGKVYWADFAKDKIYSAPLSTVNGDANTFAILTLAAGSSPNSIVLDVAANKMYWTEEGGTGRICSASMDGSNLQTVDDVDVTKPVALSIDTVNGWLYFTDRISLLVGRVKTSGLFFTAIISSQVFSPRGIAIDAAHGNVYWTDTTTNLIYRAPSDVSGRTATGYDLGIDTSSGSPTGVEVY
jgi:DNA-binding beta-propeller fold protein YncE